MLRILPEPENGRVETGPVQFGSDWPGIFIRGDNALYHAHQLGALLIAIKAMNLSEFDRFLVAGVESLASLMASADATLHDKPNQSS